MKYLNRFERTVAYIAIAVASVVALILFFSISMNIDKKVQAKAVKYDVESYGDTNRVNVDVEELHKQMAETQAKLDTIENKNKVESALETAQYYMTINHLDRSSESKEMVKSYLTSHGYANNITSIAVSQLF